MEERVATPLDHSLILDYRVLCDDRSTLESFVYEQVAKWSQDLVILTCRTFDVGACHSLPWLLTLSLPTFLLLVDVLTVLIVQLKLRVNS